MAAPGHYSPKPILGSDPETRIRAIINELSAIAQALTLFPDVHFAVLHAAPFKARPGLVAYADGTDWNPGSGEGLYIYKSTGWTFIA